MLGGRYLNINNIRIYLYDSSWEKEYDRDISLIFLHGSPGQISNWKYQIKYFKEYYRVVVYDQRGYGLSDKPMECRIEDYINDLDAIINEAGLPREKLFLIGHSFGGMVAQEYASRREVAGLVLIGSIAKFRPDLIDKIVWKLPPIFWRRLLFTENILTRRMYRKIFFSDETDEEIYLEFLRDNKDYIEGLPPHVFRYSKYYRDYDASNSVINIKAPTLIIVGRDDRVTPVEQSETLNKLIPNSKLEIIDGAGHLILYEKPDEINSLIHNFITEHTE